MINGFPLFSCLIPPLILCLWLAKPLPLYLWWFLFSMAPPLWNHQGPGGFRDTKKRGEEEILHRVGVFCYCKSLVPQMGWQRLSKIPFQQARKAAAMPRFVTKLQIQNADFIGVCGLFLSRKNRFAHRLPTRNSCPQNYFRYAYSALLKESISSKFIPSFCSKN